MTIIITKIIFPEIDIVMKYGCDHDYGVVKRTVLQSKTVLVGVSPSVKVSLCEFANVSARYTLK